MLQFKRFMFWSAWITAIIPSAIVAALLVAVIAAAVMIVVTPVYLYPYAAAQSQGLK